MYEPFKFNLEFEHNIFVIFKLKSLAGFNVMFKKQVLKYNI